MRIAPIHPNGGIWRAKGNGLGDCICYLGFLYARYKETGEVQTLATRYCGHNNTIRTCYSKLKELLPEFPAEVSQAVILQDKEAPSEHTPIYWWYYPQISQEIHLPCNHPWQGPKDSYACYQFDGRSRLEKNMNNKEHEKLIVDSIQTVGLRPVILGRKISIRDCFLKLAQCTFFIGVDSGMAHMAACVRCPIILILNGRNLEHLKAQFPKVAYTLVSDYKTACERIKKAYGSAENN